MSVPEGIVSQNWYALDYTVDIGLCLDLRVSEKLCSGGNPEGGVMAKMYQSDQFRAYIFNQGLEKEVKIRRLADNQAMIPHDVAVGNQDSNGFEVLSYTDRQGRPQELVIAVQADGVSTVSNKSGKRYATDSGLIAATLVGGSLELIPQMLVAGKLSIHELLIRLNEKLLELFPGGSATGASTFELALMYTNMEGTATVDVFSVVGMADEIHKYMGVFRADKMPHGLSNGVESSIPNRGIPLSPYYLHPEKDSQNYKSILPNIVGHDSFVLGMGDVFAIGTDGAAKLRKALQYRINILDTHPYLWDSRARVSELARSLLLPHSSELEQFPGENPAYDDQSILLLRYRPRRPGDDLEPDTV